MDEEGAQQLRQMKADVLKKRRVSARQKGCQCH